MADLNLANVDPTLRMQVLKEEALKRGLPLPPDMRAEILREEAAKRGLLVYRKFFDFVQVLRPDLLEHEYMRKQIEVAQRVVDGVIRRLMVFIPTQYGKSEIWSRLLPAFYLLKYPNRKVGLASFGADLAWELGGEARQNYIAAGGAVSVRTTKSGGMQKKATEGQDKNWKTVRRSGARGGMYAVGVRGVFLGRGFNLGIVDDPISPEQATRQTYLRLFQRWWSAQWIRAQRPLATGGSAMVFVMQRLDIVDPAAWLLSRENSEARENWHILCYDEIHSNEPYGNYSDTKLHPEQKGFPLSCTIEPDFRKVGEVLSPKWRTPEEVKHIQAVTSPLVRAAQRQQRPMRPEGDFWLEKWFRIYDQLPKDAHNGGWDWDTAYTKNELNSATGGIKSFRGIGKEDEFPIYIDDTYVDHVEFPELIRDLKARKGPHYVEAKASGKSVVQTLKTYQINADEVAVHGDKLARATAAQPAVNSGRIYVHRLVLERLLSGDQGLLRITAEALQQDGEGLDLNDAFVQAIYRHLGLGASGKFKGAFR